MYKVMIVDDEVIARVGLANTIDWEENGFSIVGQASDAASAIRIAKDTRPDIAIIDIVMPEMDGISLIGKLKEIDPVTEYIIVSCMDDVKYYRDAIDLDVAGYINKATFEAEELLQVLGKAGKKVDQKRILHEILDDSQPISRNDTIVSVLNSAIFHGTEDGKELKRKLQSFGIRIAEPYRLIVIDLSSYPGAFTDTFEKTAVSICGDIIDALFPAFTFRNTHREVISLIPGATEKEALHNMRYRVQQTFLQYYDWQPELGYSKSTEDFASLQPAYRQAKRRLAERFFNDHAPKDEISVMRPIRSKKMQAAADDLMDVKIDRPPEDVRKIIEKLTEAILDAEFYDIRTCQDLYMAFLYSIQRQYRKGGYTQEIFEEGFDARKVVEGCARFDELNDTVLSLYGKVWDVTRTSPVGKVEQVRNYVEDHITERLKVADIASALYVNPAYLGRLFFQETGRHLHSYVVDRKLENAKRLLLEKRDVTEVSGLLGFSTTSHFISLFKERFGVTPKRYIRQESRPEREEKA